MAHWLVFLIKKVVYYLNQYCKYNCELASLPLIGLYNTG